MDKNVGASGGSAKRIKISGPDDESDTTSAAESVVEEKPAKANTAKSIKITQADEPEDSADERDSIPDDSEAAESKPDEEADEPKTENNDIPTEDVDPEEPDAPEDSGETKIPIKSAAMEPDEHIEVPAQPAQEPEPEPEEHTAQIHPPEPPASAPVPQDPPVDAEEQDVFDAASHASETETDYSQYTPLRKPKKSWKKIVLWVLVSLFAIGGVAAGGYMLYKQKSDSKPTAKTESNKQSSNSSSANNQNSQSSNDSSAPGTKDYTSSNLNLSFSYPEKWKVEDTGGGKLTVTSPAQKLTDADGVSVDGKIIMRIEKQDSADMSDFKTGDAAAVLQSENIKYTNPTGTQRATTYISFVQYNSTTTKGALDGIYVTGNLGYAYAQAIKEADIAKIDPLVRVVFVKCSDSSCSSTSAMSISSDTWKKHDFADPITGMLESLSFQ